MKKLRSTLTAAVAAPFIACAGVGAGSGSATRDLLTFEEVVRATTARDYFALGRRVAERSSDRSAPAEVARALVQQAANDPERSNETIARLLERGDVPDSLVTRLRLRAMNNHLRLFQYAAGLRVVESLLADTARLTAEQVRDVRNMRRILSALADVAPQTATIRDSSRIAFVGGRIPVTVNDSLRQYVFDTGANLSTIMRSEAAALGLRILPADIDVGTSTSRRVTADLGVADRVTIGAMEFRNVVFLVLDDAMLTFGTVRIPGIVGFPVIERMGEVRLSGSRELFVPRDAPRRTQGNLAIDGLTLLIPVRWRSNEFICRLDSGANRTQFYDPFYRRFMSYIDSAGVPANRRYGGAGGIQELPVRVLAELSLQLGDTVALARNTDVLTRSIVRSDDENYLYCNVGHDILDAFATYVVNFRDMAFLLQ